MDHVTSAQIKVAQSAAAEPTPSSEESRPLRGFAAMTPEQRKALGSKGGRSAHERGTANKFTSESASAAGRRPHENGTAYRWTSEQARAAGRKGGAAARRRRELAS
jgi:general stress protein YciG